MFSYEESEFSNFRVLRLITVFERRLFSFIATSSSFVMRVLSSSASFILSEDVAYLTRKADSFPETSVFSYVLFI